MPDAIFEFAFKPEGGKMPTGVLHRLMDAVARMDGKRLVLTLKEQKRQRSSNQNRYYFGVVVKQITRVFREVGNDMDEAEVHDYLKDEIGKLSRLRSCRTGKS